MDEERMWLSRLARSDLSLLAPAGETLGGFVVPALSDSLVPRSQLVAGPSRSVLEHWFAAPMSTWSRSWSQELPLVRWFSEQGAPLGQAGSLTLFDGLTLTAALNRGFVGYARDTVWFAGAVDARVRAAPLQPGHLDSLRPVLALPVSYRMRLPVEYVDRWTGRAFSQAEYHVTTFAVPPTGSAFVFGHVLSWPNPQDSTQLYRPRTALGVFRRSDGHLRLFDLGGEIYEVRTPSASLVLVLVSDTLLGGRVVRGYRLPGSGLAGDLSCATLD
jgi:hypothetical protein